MIHNDTSSQQQTPTIHIEEANPVGSRTASQAFKNVFAPRTMPRRERSASSVRSVSLGARNSSFEKQPTRDVPKPILRVHALVLHPQEARERHSVDIVVVYLFNGAKDESALALFEAPEDVLHMEKEPSNKRERGTGDRESKSEADIRVGARGSLPIVKSPGLVLKNQKATGNSSALMSEPKNNVDMSSSKDTNVYMNIRSNSKSLPSPTVNWLRDSTMLPKIVPEARIISVGFDIRETCKSPIDIEAAATQLSNTLANFRKNCTTRPVLLIGHGYGGIFIEKMLVQGAFEEQNESTVQGSSDSRIFSQVLEMTAGVLLFSCPILGSDESRKLLAKSYHIPNDSPCLANMGTGSAQLRKLADEFNENIMPKNIHSKPHSASPKHASSSTTTDKRPQNIFSRRIGFPIMQYVSTEENVSQTKSGRLIDDHGLVHAIHRLDEADSVWFLRRNFSSMLKFSSEDLEFQRLGEVISWIVHTRLLLDAATGKPEDMESLLENPSVNVDLRDRWEQAALHIATQKADAPVQMVRVILAKSKADPSPRDRYLNTPLHYAVERKDITLVRVLLEAKADVNAENEDYFTPIDLALRHKSTKKIAKLLRTHRLTLKQGPAGGFKRISGPLPRAPESKDGQIACKAFQVTTTEIYSYDDTDHHWSLPTSVQEIIYGPESLDRILERVRPDAQNDSDQHPLCRWIHIHANNMKWVEDLFSKLGYGGSIWAGRGYTSQVPHSRSITPHVHRSRDQNREQNREALLAIFLPYISYEVNQTQSKMSEFLEVTQEKFQEEYWWRKFESMFLRLQSNLEGIKSGIEGDDSTASTSVNNPANESQVARINRTVTLLTHISESNILESQLPEPISDVESESMDPELEASTFDEYDLDAEEEALIKEYLNDPPSLHIRRTLDQYYYHMLPSTKRRDRDQVVTRWAREKGKKTHNIVMVDQLWLWQFKDSKGTDVIISSFPDRTGVNSRSSLDRLQDLILNPVGNMRHPINTSIDLLFRIIATCANIFDRCQEEELLQFLQAFENSIGKVSDRETRLFKKFQKRLKELYFLNKRHKGFENKKKDLLEKVLYIGSETELLVEIKDILDEINIVLNILRTQESILSDPDLEEHRSLTHAQDARRIISVGIADFERMQLQANTVQSSLNALMDLKQKAANAWEAKSSREGAVATTKQGNTMLVFTVVTIIFLPLSFMASFLALDVASFPQDDKGQTNWPLSVVSALLFGISFAVSVPFVIIAFSVQPMASIWRTMMNDILINAILYLLRLLNRLLRVLKAKKSKKTTKRWSEKLKGRQSLYTKDIFKKNLKRTISSSESEQGLSESSSARTIHSVLSTSGSDSDFFRTNPFRRVRKKFPRKKTWIDPEEEV